MPATLAATKRAPAYETHVEAEGDKRNPDQRKSIASASAIGGREAVQVKANAIATVTDIVTIACSSTADRDASGR